MGFIFGMLKLLFKYRNFWTPLNSWIIGYEIDSELRIRYYSPSPDANCPHEAKMWYRIERLKKFRPIRSRKKSCYLGKKPGVATKIIIEREDDVEIDRW